MFNWDNVVQVVSYLFTRHFPDSSLYGNKLVSVEKVQELLAAGAVRALAADCAVLQANFLRFDAKTALLRKSRITLDV